MTRFVETKTNDVQFYIDNDVLFHHSVLQPVFGTQTLSTSLASRTDSLEKLGVQIVRLLVSWQLENSCHVDIRIYRKRSKKSKFKCINGFIQFTLFYAFFCIEHIFLIKFKLDSFSWHSVVLMTEMSMAALPLPPPLRR
jgi:hypothetical protein